MKKGIGIIGIICLLLWGVCGLAENNLQALLSEKAQLEAQLAQVEDKIVRAQEDDIIELAIEELKQCWTEEYSKTEAGNGYLGIRFTRVVYMQEEMDLPHTDMFENMICFVEFMLLTDYFGSAPYYSHAGVNECVAFYCDGTFEVMKLNPLDMYRGMSYSSDYSGIIVAVSDRGAEFNADYMLFEE